MGTQLRDRPDGLTWRCSAWPTPTETRSLNQLRIRLASMIVITAFRLGPEMPNPQS